MKSVVIVLALLVCTIAQADELRPAYIELNQQMNAEPGEAVEYWQLRWKASANSVLGRDGQVILPPECILRKPVQIQVEQSNVIRLANYGCNQALLGQVLSLPALQYSATDALLRVTPKSSETITFRLSAADYQVTLAAPVTGIVSNVAQAYLVLGIEHILFGFDHLLFVLSLVLLINGWSRLLWTVTAFTAAHSVTLVGTTLNWFSVAQQPVEIIIALSIVFLAVEIIKAAPGQQRFSERAPWLVALIFGLLHGFGFAGALAEIGLPQNAIPLSLFMFNLGVELGQVLIVLLAAVLLKAIQSKLPQLERASKLTTAYVIGSIASFWFIERLF